MARNSQEKFEENKKWDQIQRFIMILKHCIKLYIESVVESNPETDS